MRKTVGCLIWLVLGVMMLGGLGVVNWFFQSDLFTGLFAMIAVVIALAAAPN
jgi:hypothetical protein